jgi:hypothetical protein
MTTLQKMGAAVQQMKKGRMSIGECELVMNNIIAEAVPPTMEIDKRIAEIKRLKRKQWRMMLDATR